MVTADGNVVVVVDDVVVVTRGATHPTTGIVVAVPSVEGGHKTGTDDVVVVVVVAPDAAMGVTAMTAATNNGRANRERRILHTLVMVNAHDWALQQRYWSMGFNPTRKQIARKSDIWFVIAAVAVAFALVAWAFLG